MVKEAVAFCWVPDTQGAGNNHNSHMLCQCGHNVRQVALDATHNSWMKSTVHNRDFHGHHFLRLLVCGIRRTVGSRILS